MSKPLALIIEDEADLADIYSKTLQTGGFDTQVIRDGKKALEHLATASPQVIILDLHLPYVGGAQILQHIRADARLAKTSVIVTTADERQSEELHGQADLVLLKPVSLSQLRDLASRIASSK